jgi:hypothetical protein
MGTDVDWEWGAVRIIGIFTSLSNRSVLLCGDLEGHYVGDSDLEGPKQWTAADERTHELAFASKERSVTCASL